GETGTGKELVARCLHDYSRRHQHAFVALNCGGLPENLFDSEIFGHEAHAFLERLGSNQSIPVDCRVIAATKADLAAMGKSGQFRSDLYYRLNVVSLELPA
ncbi:Fis family transcriptional regulator, partial [Escherichia coli]|uniref:sigma 54-interacting transcriptional regulator n=1 Tax=Escherichia coli TaxID=562 RepID=UPI000FF686B2